MIQKKSGDLEIDVVSHYRDLTYTFQSRKDFDNRIDGIIDENKGDLSNCKFIFESWPEGDLYFNGLFAFKYSLHFAPMCIKINNTNKTTQNMNSMFEHCSNLRTIPSELFDEIDFTKMLTQLSFISMFKYCISLTSFPISICKNLLKGSHGDNSGIFTQMFAYNGCCRMITAWNGQSFDSIFEGFSVSSEFRELFYGSSEMKSTPDYTLFNGLTDSEDNQLRNKMFIASAMFSSSGILSISSSLFDIPLSLKCAHYEFNELAENSKIEEIYPVTFKLNRGKSLSDLSTVSLNRAFARCEHLKTVSTFLTGWTVISGKYKTSMRECFSSSGVVRMTNCFITFATYNEQQNQAIDMRNMFYDCKNLGSDGSLILSDGTAVTHQFEISGMFDGCSSVISAVPELWNRDRFPNFVADHYSGENSNNVFRGCTKASNYNEIPDGWK